MAFENEYIESRESLQGSEAANALLARVNARNAKEKGAKTEDFDSQPDDIAQTDKAEDRSIAADVGRGVFVEGGTQMIGGAIDSVKETFSALDDLSKWLEEVTPLERGGLFGEVSEAIPTTPEAETETGSIIRNISNFVSGFVGAGKGLKAAKLLQGASKGATVGRAALQGAIADFAAMDPEDERFSNLIQSVPALENPINEFLAASPDDSGVEGRLKNAAEGLGLGIAVDGLVSGLRAVRSARAARKQLAELAPVEETAVELAQKGIRETESTALKEAIPGDIDSDDLFIKVGAGDPDDVEINFARIDSPDSVKQVLDEMAQAGEEGIQEARRGRISFKETELAAGKLDAWNVLQTRRKGEPLSAEKTLAVRNLWVQSGDALEKAATMAAENPSKENLFAFRRQMAVHDLIQKEAIAVRTETARALSQWRIPAKGSGNLERFSEIASAIENNGGDRVAQMLAERISVAARTGNYQLVEEIARNGVLAKTSDAVRQVWINGLLSGPQTHIVNFASNTSVMAQQITERKTANLLRQLYGGEGVVDGESMAMFTGMFEGMKDALRVSSSGRSATANAAKRLFNLDIPGAREALKEGEEGFGGVWRALATGETGYGVGKVEAGRGGAFSSDTWNVSQDSLGGRFLDTVDFITQGPGRALAVSDEFFKSCGYRMELHAQATRQATREVNSGKIPADGLKARIAEIIENPDEALKLKAADQAAYQTFTKRLEGPVSKTMERFQNIPVLGKIIMPFRNTPANILKYTFERTPLAPLFKDFREDIAAGGARADIALAKVATGSVILSVAADVAMRGAATGKGPSDSKERQTLQRQGWKPYSVKMGDRYFAYNRMDPIGATIGIAADMVDVLKDVEHLAEDVETERVVLSATMAIANNLTNKTYMSGIADAVEAIANPDMNALSYFQRLSGSVVPTFVANVARAQDPYMHAAYEILDGVRRRTPGLSNDLPYRRDLWGRKISYKSGIGDWYDVISPIYSSKAESQPIDKELNRLEFYASMPQQRTSFDGISINLRNHPFAYERLVQLAGNKLPLPQYEDKGAMDFLNALVSGKSVYSQVYDMYSDGPDGGKAEYIQNIINDYRDAAKQIVLEEYPELQADVERKRLEQPSKFTGF